MCQSNFLKLAKYSACQNRSFKSTDERDCEVFPMTGTVVTLVSSVAVVAFAVETCCLVLLLQWYNIVGSNASVCLLAVKRYHADFSFPYDLVTHKTWHRFLRPQNLNVGGVAVDPRGCVSEFDTHNASEWHWSWPVLRQWWVSSTNCAISTECLDLCESQPDCVRPEAVWWCIKSDNLPHKT